MVKRSILHEQKPEIHISLPRIVSGKCISSSSATEVWRETLAPHRRKMVWRKNQQTQAQENIAPVARNWREAAGVVGVIFRIISHDSALISFSQRSTVAAQCCRNIAKWFVPYSLDLWRLLVLQEYGFSSLILLRPELRGLYSRVVTFITNFITRLVMRGTLPSPANTFFLTFLSLISAGFLCYFMFSLLSCIIHFHTWPSFFELKNQPQINGYSVSDICGEY